MMAGNPSWWSMHNTADLRSSTATSDHESAAVAPNLFLSQTLPSNSLLPLHEYLSSTSKSSSSSSPSSFSSSFLPLTSHLAHHQHHAQDFPHSWSQLLSGGMPSEQEERYGANVFQSTRALSNGLVDVKQEVSSQRNINNNNNNGGNNNDNLYGYNHEQDEPEASNGLGLPAWSQNMPISSPRSCVTSLSSNSNMLDFSTTNKRSLQAETTHQRSGHSNSECNSSANGGVPKKPRLQSSNSIPPLKVRKEKLGDRITALHQLVSPFGKTDTASVLLEAIGYIRFLQAQIQTLGSPYLGNSNAVIKNQHSDNKDAPKDLRSKGLCLVPISCTHLVGSDNGADYWAQIQSLGGGF